MEAKARGMFAGFRPEPEHPEAAVDRPALKPGIFAGFRPKPQEPAPAVRGDVAESTTRPDQAKAIQGYARAMVDIAAMRDKGLPVLPHQTTALDRAGDALDKTRHMGTHMILQPRSSAIRRSGVRLRLGTCVARCAEWLRKRGYALTLRCAPVGLSNDGKHWRLNDAKPIAAPPRHT